MAINFRNIFLVLILVYSTFSFAQEKIKVGNVYPGEVELGGFNLSKDATIIISGEGASFGEWENYLSYYAWILESKTRTVVWRSEKCDDYSKHDGEYDFNSTLKLKSGNYEVYFASANDRNKFSVNGLGIIGGIFNGRKSNIKKFKKDFFVTIYNDENFLKSIDPFQLVDNLNKNAVVSFTRVGDSEKRNKSFSIKSDTQISIYGIGEGIRDEFYDFGYIYDLIKNRKIWMFNSSDGKYAGGGKKNVIEKAEITLPKGSYEAVYKTDDSHSFDEWNTAPPDDPQYWGFVISLVNEKEKDNIIPFNEKYIVKPFVDITKVEDEAFISQGFSISENLDVRILAVGEGHKELVDFGWIENADTKEIVWKMTYRNSEYAGGSRKNRIADEVIQLPAGNYVVYFVTDDSHNYQDWNDTPPIDEEKWGISLYFQNSGGNFSAELFEANKYVNKNIIAQITKVFDDKELKKDFSISKKSKIRIIALGESRGNDLVDYAWITDSNGKFVWEMNYNETKHAGGAEKNRIFNNLIELESGKYYLHFKTDDSHSFEEWNSTPPDNQQMFGVTILYEK